MLALGVSSGSYQNPGVRMVFVRTLKEGNFSCKTKQSYELHEGRHSAVFVSYVQQSLHIAHKRCAHAVSKGNTNKLILRIGCVKFVWQ